MWRAPFRPNPFVLGLGTINGRSGQAIANTPRPAPCLRRPVGYHALSLPDGAPNLGLYEGLIIWFSERRGF
jgi:hypothetical protein